jgi:type IV secretion system protein VirD4
MTAVQSRMMQFVAAPLTMLTCLWGATQWAASMLGHQAALGAPWIIIIEVPIYPPWQLFSWWLSFDTQAPDVFNCAGAVAAFGGLLSGAVAMGGTAWRASHNEKVTTYGSARWADGSDVASAGLRATNGVILGLYDERYLRHDGPEHVMAVAPTRSGKGVGLVVPTLLSWKQSAVIHDVKGENWELTAGWRAQFSHCLLFDPTNPLSARFNPLLEVRKGPMEVRDVQNIADILVDPDGAHERRDHWEKTAHALLVGAILHVLYAEQEKTLARVATFLSDPSRSFLRTLKVMQITNHLGTEEHPKVHPVVTSIARELLNKSDNERSGVVSTAMSYLGLYRDPVIAATTATSDWRIADLMTAEHAVSLYLVVPPSDISRTRPLVRLILNQIGRRLTESLDHVDGAPRRHKLLLMLDEFPALGRLDFFETSLAFLAGYGVRAFLVAQSLHQLDKAYGPNHAILDNCHVRVAFAPNDERTAKRLSDALGTTTELRSLQNLSGKRMAMWLSNMSVSKQETPRPLLTPGEVLQLPRDDALVLVSGAPPIRAKKLRYFEDGNFEERRKAAPKLVDGKFADAPPARADDWADRVRRTDQRLEQIWFDLAAAPLADADRPLERLPSKKKKSKDLLQQLSLFENAAEPGDPKAEHDLAAPPSADAALGRVLDFPGGVRVS